MASFQTGSKEADALFIREFVPEAAINAMTESFINVTVMRTAYARVKLVILYEEGYPLVPVKVELSSPTLPPPLLRNKETECMTAAKECIGKPSKGQVAIVYNLIHDFIQENLFVPCWREIKRVLTLFEEGEEKKGDSKIAADEKKGTLTVRLKCQGYFQSFKLTVDENYPEVGVQVEFDRGNFPADITQLFLAQSQEIVRRCEAGFSPEKAATALSDLNESVRNAETAQGACVRKRVEEGGKKEVSARSLDASGIKALKHDVGVLKQMGDLRVAAKQETKPFQYEKHAVAERKEARKRLRRLARSEAVVDSQEEEMLKEQEQREMLALLQTQCSDTAQPSLYPVAQYLLQEFVVKLPKEPCQKCQKRVLAIRNHADGTLVEASRDTGEKKGGAKVEKERKERKERKEDNKAMRTFCGHYLHRLCLDEWLTTPPFIRQCPVCDRRIWHPDWPQDHKQLEKAWQMKEAAKREQSEISDLMGF